jgi:hypothetical protein
LVVGFTLCLLILKNLLQFNIVHMCSEYARNAWHKLGAMPREEAMQEYITIVQELFPNWDAGASAVSSISPYSPHSCSSVYNDPRDSVGLSIT